MSRKCIHDALLLVLLVGHAGLVVLVLERIGVDGAVGTAIGAFRQAGDRDVVGLHADDGMGDELLEHVGSMRIERLALDSA